MHLVNSKFLSFHFGALKHLRPACQFWDDTLNILFASKGRHAYRFQPVLRGYRKVNTFEIADTYKLQTEIRALFSGNIFNCWPSRTFLFIMYLFTKFWPCTVAAPYWVLFSIVLFLQSYPSCNFIQTALNRLIHLVVNQPSSFLTAG